jgi:hypothetical protein
MDYATLAINENPGNISLANRIKVHHKKIARLAKIILAFYWGSDYIRGMKNEILANLNTVRADLRQKLLALKEEEKTIISDIEAIDRMLLRYQGQTTLAFSDFDKSTQSSLNPPSKLKDYVIMVLKNHYPTPLRASQVRDAVIKMGYKSTAISFEGAMFAMLSNLVRQKSIAKTGPGLYCALNTDMALEAGKENG